MMVIQLVNKFSAYVKLQGSQNPTIKSRVS